MWKWGLKKISPIRARNDVFAPNAFNNDKTGLQNTNGPKGSKHGLKTATNSIFGPKKQGREQAWNGFT